MSKTALPTVIVAALLVGLVLSPSITPARATPAYVPGVTSGQWAKYKVLHYSCTFADPATCNTSGPGGLVDADYGLLQVAGVSGTSVSLSLATVYKNGTASYQGLMVDVAAGTINSSGVAGSQGDLLVIAGGLVAHEPISNAANALTINSTSSNIVLGVSREVNFLNRTFSYQNPIGPGAYSFKSGLAFDQVSGLFAEISIAYTTPGPSGGQFDLSIGMVDNDIWLTSPDFSLDASPTTVNVAKGASGTSTVTLTRSYGFSPGISLRETPSTGGITCSLSSSLATIGSDSSTLSCSGPPGAYTVIVKANASYLIRIVSVTMNIDPDFGISSSGGISFHSGATGVATITINALNGYSATTNLEVTSTPSGLTCNLSNNSVSGSGSVTLTCSGQQGSYTVSVKATGGGTSHSTDMPVTVSAAPASTQPASNLPTPFLYAGIGLVAVAVAGLLAFLFLRKKPGKDAVSPGEALGPATS